MTSPLVPSLSNEFNLGGPVIESSMTLGQLKLLAKLSRWALITHSHLLTSDQVAEANSLISMFEDPELEKAERGMHHGFCL